MKKIKPRDRQLAVISFGVQLAESGRTDAARFLGEILSESITTRSPLLIHHVLKAIDDKGGRSWALLVSDVARKANDHR